MPKLLRRPAPLQAVKSVAVFTVLGPLIGLAGFLLSLQARGGSFDFHPIAIVGALAIGGIPSVAAGLLYCATTRLALRLRPATVVSGLPGAVLGVVAGVLSSWAWFTFGPGTRVLLAEKRMALIALGAVSGCVVGFLIGWVHPVGLEVRTRGESEA
jgi:hypothetical protein